MTLPLLVLLACASPAPPAVPEATPEATEPKALPPDPFSEVRTLLAPARKEARSDEERDAHLAAWEEAYRNVFEPRVEAPLRGKVDALTACEYAWGQVLVAIRDHDQHALDLTFAAWDEAMATVEANGRPLLPPSAAPTLAAPGGAPSAYGPPSTVRPEGTPPTAVPAKPRLSGGG
ncbi:MAG: hypothetical protein JXB39_01655 [Deltaproteobacteria bacterium]|nr:hypothetical protein [Deltaproteobacteria bacterium]